MAQRAPIVDPAETRVTERVRQPGTGLDRPAAWGTATGRRRGTAAAKWVAIELEGRRARIVAELKPAIVAEPREGIGLERRLGIVVERRAVIAAEISPLATINPKGPPPVPPRAALRFNRAPMARFGRSTPRVG
jgi:hypothetical protein